MRNAFRFFLFALVVLGFTGFRAFGTKAEEEPQAAELYVLFHLDVWQSVIPPEAQSFAALINPTLLKAAPRWKKDTEEPELGERYRCTATVGGNRYDFEIRWSGSERDAFHASAMVVNEDDVAFVLNATIPYSLQRYSSARVILPMPQRSDVISIAASSNRENLEWQLGHPGAESVQPLACAVEQMR